MKLSSLFLLTTVSAIAGARPDVPATQRRAIVCIDGAMDPHFGARALSIASEIYAGIGIKIDWRRNPRSCPIDGIRVQLSEDRPDSFYRGALAIALPYEGIHVEVFLNRIRTAEEKFVPTLLAHVLVHETAHILQGVDRHSETGVMKANFNTKDYWEMSWRSLGFTEEDALLIHLGMERRARSLSERADSKPAARH